MRRVTLSFLTLSLIGLIAPLQATAQTKVVFSPQKTAVDKASAASIIKADAKAKASATQTIDSKYKSQLPIGSASDHAAYNKYVSSTGHGPNLVQAVKPTEVRKTDSSTTWTYTGFNAYAGLKEDGTTTTGGLVDFNIQPFACDTVSSDDGLSPYSYEAHGKLYCYLPKMNTSTGLYNSLVRTIYDANTLERLDQKTISQTFSKDRLPYLLSYDDQRDVVYAISMGDNTAEGDQNSYYLNVLDTASCTLKRIGYLGGWNGTVEKGNFNPKSFTATGGTLRVENNDDSIYICEIDPITCKTSVVGRADMPLQYVYGLQPMIYDSNTGYLLINHYDFENGTQYYKVAPYIAYGQKDNTLKTELLENVPTGFTFFYKRPETETSFAKYEFANISDLTATVDEGTTTAKISFTVPDTDINGSKIEIPSYSTSNVRCYIYADNQYISVSGLSSTITMGQKVECTAELTSGMHVITVLLYPLYNEVKALRNSTVVVCGYDAPTTVGSPTLSVSDMKATISWKAPTKGKYSDFDSKFDASDITYKVVRDFDGKIIADGITTTSAQDDIDEEIKTYSYTIYATSHGNEGIGIKTNSVTAGNYLPMPYANDFSTSDCLNGFTIINANNDGTYRTWTWNNYSKSITSGWGTADDWLITPDFKLEAGKLYSIAYRLEGNGSLRTTVGNGKEIEDQEIVLDDVDNYTCRTERETREFYFRPTTSGNYNFAFYSYSLGENCTWRIDSLRIGLAATEDAPNKVRSLTITPDANGALGATFSFKLPTTDINGNSISSLTKVTLYDDNGNVLGSQNNVKPGADATINVKATHGWNYFKIVASNESGEGWPVCTSKFIGLDTPKAIDNFSLTWGEERTVANLSWDAPTEGVNGGYVNPSTFTYKIYKYDSSSYPLYTELGTTQGETSIEVNILDATETQDQYIFGITASNDNGESDYSRGSIVLGVPYTLPFVEPFASSGISHSPWIVTAGKNAQSWTVDGGYYNDKIQPENNDGLQLVFYNTGTEDASSFFSTPIIDFSSANKPVLSVWLHHSEAMPEEAYATVVATTDGSKNFIAIGDTIRLSGNNGWTEHVFDLSALCGKKAQVALEAYLPTPSNRIFADNWTIKEATGNDLALTAISQPYCPKVGDVADITVTVANMGATVANDYSVMFSLNGEAIDEKESSEALAIGKQSVFHFTLPVNAAQKDYVYSAEVIYDGDDNPDNNVSQEVEITPTQVDLPAPTGLALSGTDDLNWLAPATVDGREVTLDFEDVPAFTIDNINGWKTADLDGHLTLTFIQYYGNYWPYANQPLAWMTWSTTEAGCPNAAAWKPYSGEKCLIHWGNYGADAEGRTNNDADDDWFISPEVKGGTEFSFMTLSNDASSSIEVLTSSTDRKPSSFTNKVTTVTYSNISEWYEIKATLPTDAKYVALHTVSDEFGILVDDIKYTEARVPQLLGYNIYCNTENTGTTTATSAKADGKSGNYAVSAVYDMGESELSNTVAVTTGIDVISAGSIRIAGGKGTITVSGANGESIDIFSLDGQKVAASTAVEKETISVPAGVYVAKVGDKAIKVSVR